MFSSSNFVKQKWNLLLEQWKCPQLVFLELLQYAASAPSSPKNRNVFETFFKMMQFRFSNVKQGVLKT